MKGWGNVARKGAGNVADGGSASQAWRQAVRHATGEEDAAAWEPEQWIVDDEAADIDIVATPPATRTWRAPVEPVLRDTTADRPAKLPADIAAELADAGGSIRGPKLQTRMAHATRAYDRDRYEEALQVLRPLAKEAPDAASVRELLGLTLYRMGRYPAAIKELLAYRDLTRSFDQHPVLADCYRALKRWRAADETWAELKEASPTPALVAEGRIVHAGSLADRGQIADAVTTLEQAPPAKGKVRDHHLRTWYALADLYERAGEVPRARELFRRILTHDPDFYDTSRRVRTLT